MKLEIRKYGINGEGIAYKDHKPVFIDGAFVGETVDAEIVKDHGKYSYAKINTIIKKSPDRIRSECRNKDCKVCPFKELSYNAQLLAKEQILEESLRKYAVLEDTWIHPIVDNLNPHYRNQLKLPLGLKNNKLVLGAYLPNSNHFVEIRNCKVQDESLNAMSEKILNVLNQLKLPLAQKNKAGLRYMVLRGFDNHFQLTLCTSEKMIGEKEVNSLSQIPSLDSISETVLVEKSPRSFFNSTTRLLYGEKTISCEMGDKKFKVSPSAFFQLNKEQALEMYLLAADYLEETDKVYEAYCGIGSMTMFLAARCQEVVAVEENKEAIKDAQRNMALNKADNCRFYSGDAADKLAYLSKKERFSAVVLDPPRSGLSDQMLDQLLYLKP